ncbi:uncharacterized protein LOC131941706 [Physella acuta]|uniref:uncharacterized protein LOC131941706 n=1 Tax=Physella acuta TaxID=109671 RepID=UPI0027DB312E|nr:uncharacterized protein LOC131941706 [Physella acuta]
MQFFKTMEKAKRTRGQLNDKKSKDLSTAEPPRAKRKYSHNKVQGDPSTLKLAAKTLDLPVQDGNADALKLSIGERLPYEFFNCPCTQLARRLLGQTLLRRIGTELLLGRIVETEAYLGAEDKAAHSFNGKKTERNQAMFMSPGTAYVYNIYGMYCCFNISSQGDGCAVLLRALEPISGIQVMRDNRKSKATVKEKHLTNGPSKLCQAFSITKAGFNQTDLTTSDEMWLEYGGEVSDNLVVSCERVNIGYAGDWVDKPLRFYLLNNYCVSVRNKEAENKITKKLEF